MTAPCTINCTMACTIYGVHSFTKESFMIVCDGRGQAIIGESCIGASSVYTLIYLRLMVHSCAWLELIASIRKIQLCDLFPYSKVYHVWNPRARPIAWRKLNAPFHRSAPPSDYPGELQSTLRHAFITQVAQGDAIFLLHELLLYRSELLTMLVATTANLHRRPYIINHRVTRDEFFISSLASTII